MSISTSSTTAIVHASTEAITQPVLIAAATTRPSDEKDQTKERNNSSLATETPKVKIEEPQEQQVKRRKEANDAISEGASATKRDTIIGKMADSLPKLATSMVRLNTLEKGGQDGLRQPFIVTGHIVEHRLPQAREVKSASISSNKFIAQKMSNIYTNNVSRSNSNNNLWKLSGNHVVKLETPSSTVSKTINTPSQAAIIKKAPTSRPDLVASSISALHAGNHLNQARTRPLLMNHPNHHHHHHQLNHIQNNHSNTHSGPKATRDTNSDAGKTVATTPSPQLILSSITTSPSIKVQQLANGSGSASGLQFCVSASPNTSSVPLTKFSSSTGSELMAASTNSSVDKATTTTTTASGKRTSSLSPVSCTKVKACKQEPFSDTAESSEKLASSSGTMNGTANVAAAARLLDLGKKLIEAAKEGKTSLVRELVVDSGAPFTSDWLDTSALHIAAQNGFTEIAEILIQGGINKDARTKLGRTALHLAAQSGNLEVADLLIRSGSDVNSRDMLKMTPLHWAVERGHLSVVKRLLVANADYKVKNKFQLSPLDIAKNSGFFDIIELFKNRTSGSETGDELNVYSNLEATLNESQNFLDIDYHLALADTAANGRDDATLDREEPCFDLVGFEWNKFDFAPDLFLPNSGEEEHNVGYLMKIVEELQKENQQLRQKVEQLSTTDP